MTAQDVVRDQGADVRGPGRLLDRITGPDDVAGLDRAVLPMLAEEIRDRLITTVTRTGGHLGPNLGVVELTIALHRCFRSPAEPIVFDTGHQSYVHKMLTGRLDRLATLRQYGGLSGYPCRAESPHDLVENSHASTALSYADGLAKGLALRGDDDARVVAVVGDGAMTGGLCWEALNNIAAARRPVIIVLNDNGRAYSPTVGAFARHLADLGAGRAEGNLFEDLGLRYLGPVDGHDLGQLEDTFRAARGVAGPVVVHCRTRKGHGYRPAEMDETDRMHSVGPARRRLAVVAGTAEPGAGTDQGAGTAQAPAVPPVQQPWTDVFAEQLLAVAERRPDIVGVTAAMPVPTGLAPLAARYPDRVHDVGIAEQHAVTSAAGLATAGLHPVVAIYSTFLNRAFDQVLMDVALHRLPVTFVLDRAGITGPDGPSHHGMWDLGLLGLVPGLELAAPRDAARLRELFDEAVAAAGPRAVRFPRGRCPAGIPSYGRIGRADLLTAPTGAGAEVAVLPVGPLAGGALAAAARLAGDGVTVEVVDPRWLTADDELVAWAARHRLVVTVEDNAAAGGWGDLVARRLRARTSFDGRLLPLSLGDDFLVNGERDELLARSGLDATGILRAVRAALPTGRRH